MENFLALRFPVYAVNRTKRLIKAPKIYWGNPAFALHLGGESEPCGALKNLVLLNLLAWSEDPRCSTDARPMALR